MPRGRPTRFHARRVGNDGGELFCFREVNQHNSFAAGGRRSDPDLAMQDFAPYRAEVMFSCLRQGREF